MELQRTDIQANSPDLILWASLNKHKWIFPRHILYTANHKEPCFLQFCLRFFHLDSRSTRQYKYNSFEELTPEILRAFIEKVVVHERTKVDEHYRQTVEIFYNFVGAIDRPIWGNELSDDDWNRQTAREKAWHHATPDSEHSHLPKNPYGKTSYKRLFV